MQGKVPDNIISTLPKEKLFIVRPSKNSLQNRYLPLDLIRTDAVVILDDDVRISNPDFTLGFRQDLHKPSVSSPTIRSANFRTWQANPSKLLGFVKRSVSMESQGKFEYTSENSCYYNMILHPMFFHRFYLYVSTELGINDTGMKTYQFFCLQHIDCISIQCQEEIKNIQHHFEEMK